MKQATDKEVGEATVKLNRDLPDLSGKVKGWSQDGDRLALTGEAIDVYRLFVIETALQVKAQTGMALARNMPTVRLLKARYPKILSSSVRTYKQAYEEWKGYIDHHYRSPK